MTAALSVESAAQVVGGYAAVRVVRLLTLSLGISNVALLGANLPGALAPDSVLPWSLTVAVIALLSGSAIVAFSVFAWASPAGIRWLWRAQAVGMLLAAVAVPITLAGAKLPESVGLTWLSELEILAGCAAVLAWNTRGAVLYAVALQSVMLGTALFWGEGGVVGRAFGDATRQLFFVSFFMSLAVALVRAGHLLDATVDSAVADARVAAATEASRNAARRVELLVHDSVLVALRAYSSGAGALRSAAEAADALAAIRSAGLRAVTGRAPSPRDLAWALQALTTELDPDASFSYTAEGDEPVPAAVADAITEATSEALRNSLRHAPADRPTLRQLNVCITSHSVKIVILDDGDGFDVQAVDPTRIGIRRGIIGRLRSIPGGGADVISTRGFGTTVIVDWTRP